MSSMKNSLAFVAMTLGTCAAAEGGGWMHHGAVYHGSLCNDMMCIPRRVTYGYTPTTWRRWPTEVAAAPGRTVEQLPTPAIQPQARPSDESPMPTITPEDAPLMPTEPGLPATPPSTPPDMEAPLVPPFDDAAPTPPAAESAPTTPPQSSEAPATPPPATLPEPPSQLNISPLDADPPPSMPADEDPFKDEPAPNSPPSTDKSNHDSPSGRYQQALERQAAMRWQVLPKAPGGVTDGPRLEGISTAHEPRRLRVVENDHVDREKLLPTSGGVKRNPLRAASSVRPGDSPNPDDGIVPTAGTAAERHGASLQAEPPRHNPLRATN